ncbi:MAG: type II secretion system protein GspM [Betaproteobacteria bacterium]
MTASAMPAPVALWWATKSPVERRIVVALAAFVAIALAWVGAWQPLARDVASMRADAPREAAALADARRTVDEIAGLGRAAAVPATDSRADAERVLATQGLRSLATRLDVAEGRVHLLFDGVAFDRLVPVLEALQRDARLRLVEGTLTARVEPGTVRAELTLSR